jgi:hypothetical protein
MNQLSNIVVDLARYRRAGNAVRRRPAPDLGTRRGGALSCRWRRDAATGRLICAWSAGKGAREAQPPLRRSLAN